MDDVLVDVSQLGDSTYTLSYRVPQEVLASSVCKLQVRSFQKVNQQTYSEVAGPFAEFLRLLQQQSGAVQLWLDLDEPSPISFDELNLDRTASLNRIFVYAYLGTKE